MGPLELEKVRKPRLISTLKPTQPTPLPACAAPILSIIAQGLPLLFSGGNLAHYGVWTGLKNNWGQAYLGVSGEGGAMFYFVAGSGLSLRNTRFSCAAVALLPVGWLRDIYYS